MNDFASFNDNVSGAFATIGNSVEMADMNKGVTPLFFIETLPDQMATDKAGTLKTMDMECVRLHIAGDMNSAAVHPVTEEIKTRFADAYAKWKVSQNNDHIDGTPMAEWPLASKGMVMELKALHIRSVEDLANTADINIGKITDGRQWRERAKAWLATSKEAGQAAKYAAENERLRDDIDELKRTVAELSEHIKAGDDKKSRKTA